jgi:quinol monooxygenase YgiN
LVPASVKVMHGIYVRFRARPGRGDELVAALLDGIHSFGDIPACELCLVNRSPDDPDLVYVTEVWSSRAEHQAFAARADVQAFIEQVHALAGEPPEVTYVVPVGGVGLAEAAATAPM